MHLIVVRRDLTGYQHLHPTRDPQGTWSVPLALAAAGPALLQTVETYVGSGGTLEGTARALFVHPNTVRYRLRKARDLTGLDASRPRDAYTLQVAITLGRLLAPGVAPITVAASPPIEL